MPTYQYACTACEHRFEAVQKFTDASLTDCPECAGKLRKLYSSVGVVFKGSGFYRTDSRSKTSSSSDSAKPADSKPAESKPADSKPAAKPAASSTPAKAS